MPSPWNKRRVAFHVVLPLLASGALVFWWIATLNRQAATYATQSCLGSIEVRLTKMDANSFQHARLDCEWRPFSDAQIEALRSQGSRSFDCGYCKDDHLCDAWKRPLTLSCRSFDGAIQLRVSSRGPDGRAATPDDLYRETPLK